MEFAPRENEFGLGCPWRLRTPFSNEMPAITASSIPNIPATPAALVPTGTVPAVVVVALGRAVDGKFSAPKPPTPPDPDPTPPLLI